MRYKINFLALFAISLLIACIVHIWFPDCRHYFLTEDSWIENLSAAFYLSSGILASCFLIKWRDHRNILALLLVLGFLGFLDELSFGQRIFGFSMTHVSGVEIDAVHDLFERGLIFLKKFFHSHTVYAYILIGTVVFGVIAGSRCWQKLMKVISCTAWCQPYIFLEIFVILIFFALLIDLEIVKDDFLLMLEELFEMNAAIALLFCWLSLPSKEQLQELLTRT